jgi:hypothetical protein
VGKPEGKTPLGRWENNIKMNLREIGWCCMGSIDLTRGRDQWRAVVNTIMGLCVP